MRCVVAVLALACAPLVAGCGRGTDSAAPLPLRPVEDVALPGSTGRFDYVSLDPGRHVLAIAHLADSAVIGFDTSARRVLWESHDVGLVHGVRVAPDVGRVFASATATNEVVALDEATGAVLGRAPVGDFPDGLAYDPPDQLVFVSDKNGGTETVVDARSFRVLGHVSMGHDVGNVQYDDGGHTMVIAVGATNELVSVDPASRRVRRRIPLPGCQGAHGVALDTPASLAFVACEDNAVVLSVNLRTGRVAARRRTGRTPDVLAFDADSRRLYVAAEDGVVSAFAARDGSLSLLGSARVADGAHSVAVDPTTHLVYLPLPNVRGRPVLRVMAPTR